MNYIKKYLYCTNILVVISIFLLADASAEVKKTDVERVLSELKDYQPQMSPHPLRELEQLIRQSDEDMKHYIEQQMLQMLQTDATMPAKRFICSQLWVIGSSKSVPVLQQMLLKEETVEIACYALRSNPSPEASQALRETLKKVNGKTRIHIINILGERRDKLSTPLLVQLLNSEDENTVHSAAIALGKIGGWPAAKALKQLRCEACPKTQAIATYAYLQCAQTMAKQNQHQQAWAIYNSLLSPDEPLLIRRAALMGLMSLGGLQAPQTYGEQALDIVISILQSDDEELKLTAIANSTLLQGQNVTERLVSELLATAPSCQLSPTHQALLINALVDRGDTSVVEAITAATKSSYSIVRIAALTALGTIGNASSVEVLAKAISQPHNSEEKQVALACLRRLNAPGVEQEIIKMMSNSREDIRPEYIAVLSDRQALESVPALLKETASQNKKISSAAFKALGKLASPKELASIINQFVNNYESIDPAIAERAIISIARRISPATQRTEVLLTIFDNIRQIPGAPKRGFLAFGEPSIKCSLLRILGGIADAKALEVLEDALNDDNIDVRDTSIRELSNWPNAQALDTLLAILKNPPSETYRVLAFRGYVRLLGLPSDRPQKQTLQMYEVALKYAKGSEDIKLVLSGLANLNIPQPLKILSPFLMDTTVKAEAAIAIDKLISNIKPVSIFDGKTLNGWEGNLNVFRVEDGAIVAGNLKEEIAHTEYLCTIKQYRDFELRLKAKLVGEGDNAGVQFRSRRVPNQKSMYGYQADMGRLKTINLWGCLYDETRHKLLAISDQEKIAKVFKPGDWNELVIRGLGKHIQIWVNGLKTVDYIEPDDSIKQVGVIGLQIHSGPPCKVWYKDIMVKNLSP